MVRRSDPPVRHRRTPLPLYASTSMISTLDKEARGLSFQHSRQGRALRTLIGQHAPANIRNRRRCRSARSIDLRLATWNCGPLSSPNLDAVAVAPPQIEVLLHPRMEIGHLWQSKVTGRKKRSYEPADQKRHFSDPGWSDICSSLA